MICVRPMHEFDVPGLLSLCREMHGESSNRTLAFDEPKMIRMFWEIMGTPLKLAAVAREEDAVIGALLAWSGPMYFTSDIVADEFLFFVTKQRRGSMAAVKLIRFYKDWAVRVGAKKIFLSAKSGVQNERVGRLYERLGFESHGLTYSLEV